MDFIRSHFGKMQLWPVEHFCPHFFLQISTDLDKKWEKIVLKYGFYKKSLRKDAPLTSWTLFSSLFFQISVQLVRGASFRGDFLQNLYFRTIYSNSERWEQFFESECFFNLFLEVSQIKYITTIRIEIGKR